MILLVLLLGFGFAACQTPVNPADFPKTTALRSAISGVAAESYYLKTCIHKVTSPVGKVIKFSDDIHDINDDLKKIEGRIDVLVGVMRAVMHIPYVGQVAAFILTPAIAALDIIKNGLAHVQPEISKFAGMVHKWTEPLKEAEKKIAWVEGKLGHFGSIVTQIEAKAAAAQVCVNSLPHGSVRNTGIHALEGVSGKLDVVPKGFKHAFGAVNSGCSKVESVLHKIHLVRKRRDLPGLHTVKHVLDAILHAFGPIGDFLDKVNHLLHKKFCLLHSLAELGKVVFKVGEKVIKDAKHFVDEAGHVWVEIEAKVEHVLHDVVHGVVHVGKEVANGAEHIVHEAVHGAKTVVKGVEKVGDKVGLAVGSAVHSIGHAIHHIFGRRDVHPVYRVDGKLYVLVDGRMNTRNRRGIDVCISLNDVLKGVNLVTGGLMKKAEGLIKKLIHGHSPFKIPGWDITNCELQKGIFKDDGHHLRELTNGLTGDVLNLGKLLQGLDLADLLPSANDILKLPKVDIEKILKLNVKLFEHALPECHKALSHLQFGY